MGRRYASELAELETTYQHALATPPHGLSDLLSELSSSSIVFIGTGGTSAIATLAADEHIKRTGHLASSMTPLAFVALNNATTRSAIVIFSSRARHPDIAVAAQAARASATGLIVLVTQRNPDDLDSSLAGDVDVIVTLPPFPGDGFLATNSLMGMATCWLAATGHSLPDTLPYLRVPFTGEFKPEVRRIVVMHASEHRAVAADIETRLSESGIADVQVTDIRNIAHGRHFGLAQANAETALVLVVGPEAEALAERTAPLLPPPLQTITLRTPFQFPLGALDCLTGAMQMFGNLTSSRGVDPGRPHVPANGRKLYRLPWSRDYGVRRPRSTKDLAIQRKIRAANLPTLPDQSRRMYRDQLNTWLETATGTNARGLVLDYDGTCCTTAARTSPPIPEVTTEVIRLLSGGLPVAFATGRGGSVHGALRSWIPQNLWGQVQLGMYNGGVIQPLQSDLIPREEVLGELSELADILDEALRCSGVSSAITRRRLQLTIASTTMHAPSLVGLVQAVAAAHSPTAKVQASGHSIDIIPGSSSKLNVISALGCTPGESIAIGDRGEMGGNDFELLAGVAIGLSVDRVSADPLRCWNLAPQACTGPLALLEYLRAIRLDSDGARINPTYLGLL